MTRNLSYLFFKSALAYTQKPHFDSLLKCAENPRTSQQDVLESILRTNEASEFGREFKFRDINSAEAYREIVPVCDFERLQPYIERQRDLGVPSLTCESPVYYNRTSGTTGVPKDVPITQQCLDETKSSSQLSAYVLARQSYILRGKVFAIGGPAVEHTTQRGTSIGSASGMLYRQQSRFVRSRYVLPPEVFDIQDVARRYLVSAIFGLDQENVSTIATANPSTFVRLHDVIQDHAPDIIRHVADGTMPECDVSLPTLKRNPSRAHELEEILNRSELLRYSEIWPRLKGVVTWCGGSCGFALSKLRPLLPAQCKVFEFGYNSSEFRGTINVDLKRNLCLPMLHHSFFEFVECDDWESGRARFLDLHELDDDKRYYIFATTSSGLYRYDINDIVRVSGRINATPTLEFVQKGRGVTNITGEKLTEYQVLEGIKAMKAQIGVDPDFFIVLADEENAGYLLCMELSDSIDGDLVNSTFDRHLQEINVEYESKRKSGRLHKVKFLPLPIGSGYKYRSELVASGQRDAQFKYLHLQYLRETKFNLPKNSAA